MKRRKGHNVYKILMDSKWRHNYIQFFFIFTEMKCAFVAALPEKGDLITLG